MNPYTTPKAKKTASINPGVSSTPPQTSQAAQGSQVSSLVSCPICEKQIPSWFVNNHLDNDCSGMESVADSMSQLAGKRKHDDFMDDFEGVAEDDPFQSPRGAPATRPSFSSEQSMAIQSRKDKVNAAVQRSMPLAERARPTTLDDYIGQQALIGPGGLLRALVIQDNVPSIILWGPCGVGKTTLARIIAHTTKAHFKEMGATTHGVGDVRKAFEDAKNLFQLTRQRTIIFLDEIHRFNKSQQDIFLPFVEKGTITLIGATTENPSFRINNALLSRCRVLTLEKLSLEDGMDKMIRRAGRIKWRDILDQVKEELSLKQRTELSKAIGTTDKEIDDWADSTLDAGALKWLVDLSDGDGRSAINTLEIALQGLASIILPDDMDYVDANSDESSDPRETIVKRLLSSKLTAESVKSAFQKTHLQYDRQGDEHYNLISALHKSIRGSDADATLYWLGRMLVAGEEPLYIARRLIRVASEDIGLADASALPLAMATYQACQVNGMPECDVNLAHCAVYMAKAKKCIDVYKAYQLVKDTVAEEYAYPVPIHLRNAPTTLMKNLGYGAGYKYNPDYPEGYKVDQEYLPKELKKRQFMGQFKPKTLEELAEQ